MRYVFGDYVLDTPLYELRQGVSAIPLRPQAFQVVANLMLGCPPCGRPR
jgi:hypothetical protein